MLKDRLQKETIVAMKAKLTERLSTLRMINAKIKDQEINNRVNSAELTDSQIIALLDKMVKQRQDSAVEYKKADRVDLALKEEAEVSLIKEFMPNPLTEVEVDKAITQAVEEIKPSSQKDMGKIINHIKDKYVGQVDMGVVSQKVKQILLNY